MHTYEYDLMVIGNTPEARYAALLAAQQSAASPAARVALITQAQPRQDLLLQGQSAQHQTQTTGSYDPAHPSLIAAQDLLSPYTLAVAGVDEVTDAGTWAFSSPQSSATSPGWVWQTQRASHQAERYLLATGQAIDAPAIAQALDPIVTLPQVLTQPWQTLPQRWVIVGATPMALVVAQSLRRTGRDVTMVLRDRLLPQEDQVIVHYLQAILEAAGIRLYTHTEIQHVQQLENQQWLQVGNRAIESDRILWAEPAPRIWAGLTIAPGSPQVRANRQLRVEPFRNLYVCGGWLGGYDALELGQYEAAIAVHNCLHRRQRSVDYRAVAWVLPTEPPLARVGLTPAQACRRYGAAVQIQTEDWTETVSARLTETTVGLCRWVTGERGRILGATLLGPGADRAVGAIAIPPQQGLTVEQMGHYHSVGR